MKIDVVRRPHGPFERIVLSFVVPTPVGPIPAESSLSVYRLGDTLIDTGSSITAATLIDTLRDTPPTRIVLTHQHEDHMGGLAALLRAFGDLPVYVPRTHVPIVQTFDWVPLHRELYWGHPEPVQDILPYDEGDTFEVGGLVIEPMLTPGHTPGHMTLAVRWGNEVYACSGDLYLGRRFAPAWHENAADDLIASQRRVAALGHGLRLMPTHGKVRNHGARFLTESADRIARGRDLVLAKAQALDTTDLPTLTAACFGPDDPLGPLTSGEICNLAFVRSVLQPVRVLPSPSLAPYFTPSG